jgi:hypothetical protein
LNGAARFVTADVYGREEQDAIEVVLKRGPLTEKEYQSGVGNWSLEYWIPRGLIVSGGISFVYKN